MTHIEILEAIAQCYGRPRYLEIGLGDTGCFNRVGAHCSLAVGVDVPENPYGDISANATRLPHARFFDCGSDEFFAAHPDDRFDLIFIDGSHWYEQVSRDFNNAWRVLAPLGTICLHDTWAPTKAEAEQGSDTAYLVAVELELDTNWQTYTLPVRPGLTICRLNEPRFRGEDS